MSKNAVVEVRENAQKRKNEYFVKGFDITESVEFLLAEVEKDYEFKKQVELQFGFHSCNDILNKQAEKYRKQIFDLEAKLAEAQKTIEIQRMSNDALREENLDYSFDITDTAYEQAKEMASNWESQYQEEVKELKAKLAESETLIQRLQSVIDNLRNKSFAGSTLVDAITNVYEPIYKVKFDECEELKQQLHQIYSHLGVEAFCEDIHEQALKEIGRLQQQLAEKEKRIKKLNYEAQKYYEDAYCNDFHNQDKISFCIERLEKVKEFVNETSGIVGHEWRIDRFKVLEEIDNQIKQLKEGM